MKFFLQNLGLLIIIIAAVVLILCAVNGNVNNNAVLGFSILAMIVGFVMYIMINRRITN